MKGGFGCSPCCGPTCDACTLECQKPHTGGAFQTVYHLYALGEEAGNPSDGYLTATGDVDTSDPYDGMDGSGPWYQNVGGGFQWDGTQNRIPCTYRVSFWRSQFILGASPVPPPSSTPTLERIRVTCVEGTILVGDGPFPDEITAGNYKDYGPIPLVSGTGDRSAYDPHSGAGTISIRPKCDKANFTVGARVEWDKYKRQHVVYGKVRECYDEPDPENPEVTSCDTFCSGSPPPSALYLTISGLSHPTIDVTALNGTYVLDPWNRNGGICNQYLGVTYAPCGSTTSVGLSAGANISSAFLAGPTYNAFLGGLRPFGGTCYQVFLGIDLSISPTTICSSSSGTGNFYLTDGLYYIWSQTGAFSWTLSP